MNSNIVYCEICREDVSCNVENIPETQTFKGEDIQFIATVAKCDKCNGNVFVGEFMEDNLKRLYDAYRVKNDIISLEHICEIPIKYGIGKRPLSLLLGWGELTFTRYCDGDMPTKQYSNILNRVYNDPSYYLSFLESNKSILTAVAYKKSERAVQGLLEKSKPNSITIYLDEGIREEFDVFCENVGISVATAFNIFIRATLRTRTLPFSITDAPTSTNEKLVNEN